MSNDGRWPVYRPYSIVVGRPTLEQRLWEHVREREFLSWFKSRCRTFKGHVLWDCGRDLCTDARPQIGIHLGARTVPVSAARLWFFILNGRLPRYLAAACGLKRCISHRVEMSKGAFYRLHTIRISAGIDGALQNRSLPWNAIDEIRAWNPQRRGTKGGLALRQLAEKHGIPFQEAYRIAIFERLRSTDMMPHLEIGLGAD